jgi:hypothetical protein
VTTVEEYAARPRDQRIHRLTLTAEELHALVQRADPDVFARRPGPKDWAPVEIVGHLRDTEEWFLLRCRMALESHEPPFPRNNPDRWAIDRQYLRHDLFEALAAFQRSRDEMIALFRSLSGDAWERAGVHLDGRGRRTIDQFLTVTAWHDDNHLDQLARAMAGRP